MSRAQITKERNTECWQFQNASLLRFTIGITISQTLMATNSPLFSMMFTVTWDHRIQNWYYHCCKCVWCYLPSWCGGVTNTSWVFQPLVHHCLSLLGVLLEPVVVPVLLTRRSLTFGSQTTCFLSICCVVTCRNLPNSIPSTRAMPNWLVTCWPLMINFAHVFDQIQIWYYKRRINHTQLPW